MSTRRSRISNDFFSLYDNTTPPLLLLLLPSTTSKMMHKSCKTHTRLIWKEKAASHHHHDHVAWCTKGRLNQAVQKIMLKKNYYRSGSTDLLTTKNDNSGKWVDTPKLSPFLYAYIFGNAMLNSNLPTSFEQLLRITFTFFDAGNFSLSRHVY